MENLVINISILTPFLKDAHMQVLPNLYMLLSCSKEVEFSSSQTSDLLQHKTVQKKIQ